MKRTSGAAPPREDGGVRRRDFINIAAVSFAGVGGVALLYPLVNQMNPSADVLALAQIDVDISAIQPGQAIKTIWRKQPIFIRNLTPAEMPAANAVDVGIAARSADARRADQGRPPQLADHARRLHPSRLRAAGRGGGRAARASIGGYFCPCHGSHYDTAARIRKGPAPRNLEVPEYEFTSDTVRPHRLR